MASVNPYSAPQSSVSTPFDDDYGDIKILSLRLRMGRLRYVALYFGTSALFMLAYIIIGALAVGMGQQALLDEQFGAQIGIGVIALIVILLLITLPIAISATVQRLHDIDASGWFALLLLAPLLNLVLLLVLLFKRGTAGANRFGRPPPPNTVAVKAVFWLTVIFFLLIAAASVLSGIYMGALRV